jgi:amino acid transporter
MSIILDDKGIIQENTTLAQPKKNWQNWLIGNPLATSEAPHQTIGKMVGLAVFSSDALSSVAYSTQEMLIILAIAGTAAFQFSIPLTFAIIVLLVILTLSYEQTIHAYPGGGGAYIVARDNLGELPAQTAGAALLTDYILTVAVSISSAVAQIISAYPDLFPYRVWIAVAMVGFVTMVNLRGVKESGITFAIPTYFFLVMMYMTVGVGLFRYLTGTLGPVTNPPAMEMIHSLQPIAFFLILKAFASGTTALTGVEAISNGIMAFKEPRSKNAGQTLIWMSVILGSLLLGVAFLAHAIGGIPSEEETIISQIGRTAIGNRGMIYLAVIASTSIILMMAANTAYADFPRLSALIASDGFLPRQLSYRGSRLVFSRGIVSLAIISSLLIMAFQTSVTRLIPLYAIGVFLSFTLSQAGMARRWWKVGHLQPGEEIVEQGSTLRFEKGWRFKMVINGFGSFCTFIVMIVFAVTKFKDGAWIVVLLIPILVTIFFAIHRHYKKLAQQLSLTNHGSKHRIVRHRVLMPVGGVHNGTLQAIRYARTLSDDITAVHVSIDPIETAKIQKKWEIWGEGIRLVILDSPYRVLTDPMLEYIEKVEKCCQSNEVLTIVVPQFVPKHWWASFLHQRTGETLRKIFVNRRDIVITEVPYQVD